MALCERLETSLTAATTTRARLLESLLAEALAPADDRELEAAELGSVSVQAGPGCPTQQYR